MSKNEIVNLLIAISKVSCGFAIHDAEFLTEGIDRTNTERHISTDIETYVDNYYDLIVEQLKEQEIDAVSDDLNDYKKGCRDAFNKMIRNCRRYNYVVHSYEFAYVLEDWMNEEQKNENCD